MRLLFAEDEADLNRILTRRLKEEGYSVDSCLDGQEAIDCIDAADYDAAVLDIMMPKKDGFQVLSHLRKKQDGTPVLFLTARDAVEDRVKGLDLGADDYLVKPFSTEELLARIRALIRKSYHKESSPVLTAGDLMLDPASHRVARAGKEITLSAKEYELLNYLMHNKNIVLSREQIENHIWNFDYEGGTNVVDVYIRYLRKKLDEGYTEKLIHTVRGSGYVLKSEEEMQGK